jgi:signal transduction histidine kinase
MIPMGNDTPANAARILILAPTARDGTVSSRILTGAGFACIESRSMEELCARLRDGAAAVIVPEELAIDDSHRCLAQMLNEQPVWSDLPVIVLARAAGESPLLIRLTQTLGNVSVIERPMRISTLVSIVRSAARARQRQYEIRDYLTERAQVERQLKDARDEAEAASSAKDQFIAVLSHELRTPLTPVAMTAAALEMDPELPERFRMDLGMIRRNIDLETKLIDDLLDLSRVTSGKLALRMQPVSVHDLLVSSFAICKSDLQSKQIRFSTDLGAPNDHVVADAARLQQVFWNLIKNGVKFTPDGGTIEVNTRQLDGHLRIEVIDNGVGIPPPVLPRIFNAFDQGDLRTNRQFGGLGLGLAISRAIVEVHGGKIAAESGGADRGSTFVIDLPTTHAELPRPSKPDRIVAAPPAEGRKWRVLLAEDHPDTARVLQRLLALSGYDVKHAPTVAGALELLDAEPFDLIVSDVGLPDASGYDLIRHVRQRSAIPAVALSGYGMDSDLERSRAAGFSEHLTKPVNFDLLQETMARLIAS